MRESVELPFQRRVEGRTRFAGGSATRLQLQRRALHYSGDVAIDEPERRILFLVFLDVRGVKGRQPGDVVDALDVPRLEALRFPATLVEFTLPAGFHQIDELLILKFPDLLGRPAPSCSLKNV